LVAVLRTAISGPQALLIERQKRSRTWIMTMRISLTGIIAVAVLVIVALLIVAQFGPAVLTSG
jgi:hypothetical protein